MFGSMESFWLHVIKLITLLARLESKKVHVRVDGVEAIAEVEKLTPRSVLRFVCANSFCSPRASCSQSHPPPLV
jgi:hypothetical protein